MTTFNSPATDPLNEVSQNLTKFLKSIPKSSSKLTEHEFMNIFLLAVPLGNSAINAISVINNINTELEEADLIKFRDIQNDILNYLSTSSTPPTNEPPPVIPPLSRITLFTAFHFANTLSRTVISAAPPSSPSSVEDPVITQIKNNRDDISSRITTLVGAGDITSSSLDPTVDSVQGTKSSIDSVIQNMVTSANRT